MLMQTPKLSLSNDAEDTVSFPSSEITESKLGRFEGFLMDENILSLD
jgi:hypothetical protein